MKIMTRVLAWLYIVFHSLLLFFAALIACLSVLSPDSFTAFGEKYIPKFSVCSNLPEPLSLGVAVAGVMLLLASMVTWVFLLHKHEWAWWILTSLFSLAGIEILVSWLSRGGIQNAIMYGQPGKLVLLFPYAVTVLLLLNDHPSHWRKRTVTNRKRRLRSTHVRSATTSRPRSRTTRRK